MSTSGAEAQRDAYRWCRALASSHYENFPVASRLLPRRLRDPVAAIYAFARIADDIADEGERNPEQRLHALDAMLASLEDLDAARRGGSPLYLALADTVNRHSLPVVLLRDLLSAFRQDVSKQRYASFGELMDYCRRSANPIGRLLLHLAGQATERKLALSDAICSALQLTNFLQDLAQDYRENGRIYLPQDEMRRFRVSDMDIAEQRTTPQLQQLIRFQIQRTAQLLRAGSPLGNELRGRFGLEIRAIVLGGSRILEKLHQQHDVFCRPRLTTFDRTRIVLAAFRQGLRTDRKHASFQT